MTKEQIIQAINRSKLNPGTLEENFWNAKLVRLGKTPETVRIINDLFLRATSGECTAEEAADEILAAIQPKE